MTPRSTSHTVVSSSSIYFASQVLLALAGLASMPILTRLLSRDEFGLLSLVLASVSVLGVFGRLGFPQATTRFLAEQRRRGALALQSFCENMLGGALVSGLLIALLAFVGADLIAGGRESYALCLRLASIVVVTRVLSSVILEIYRADGRVLAFSVAQIVSRYATLALAVAFLVLRDTTAYQIVAATVIGETAVGAVCLVDLARRGLVRRPRLSRSILLSATIYGAPLAAAGSASFILELGDRFLIERLLGLSAVALYTVPYDLTQRIAILAFSPIRLAVLPMVFHLWEQEGEAATARFVSQVFSYTIALAAPIAALLLIVNRDLILLMATTRYTQSVGLTAYFLPGILLAELNFLAAAGLMIHKRTAKLAAIALVSAVLNIGLNILLLPLWGLAGAALATTMAYAVLTATTYALSRKALPLRLRGDVIAKSLLATALMAVALVSAGHLSAFRVADLVARISAGLSIYAAVMLCLDRDLRQRVCATVAHLDGAVRAPLS